ncbi:MAG: diaminopimelate epimerase [Muribaculaceae bacterium]|nr:diaminopimelate epimerase [Muribaculaceae bacterium]
MEHRQNFISFSKMHGAGNDYIYIDATKEIPSDLSGLAIKMSDVHFGIGSDGLVAIMLSDVADFRMRMFNSDGSEAEMCGNASRCVAKYVYEKGLTDSRTVTLETLAGIKILHLDVVDGKVVSVTVDMGAPEIRPDRIPVASSDPEKKVSELETVAGFSYPITGVSMGNPHGIIFVDEITDKQVLGEGPLLEVADIFPRKANIEFARVIDPNTIEMRVWERGTGETLACGTGACATAVAAVLNGLTERKVEMRLRGGTLHIFWDPETGHVLMTGPAAFICDGNFYL